MIVFGRNFNPRWIFVMFSKFCKTIICDTFHAPILGYFSDSKRSPWFYGFSSLLQLSKLIFKNKQYWKFFEDNKDFLFLERCNFGLHKKFNFPLKATRKHLDKLNFQKFLVSIKFLLFKSFEFIQLKRKSSLRLHYYKKVLL